MTETVPRGLILAGDPEALREERVGGKAMNLARLEAAGFRVPPWFAVDASAFAAFAERVGLARVVREALDGRDLDAPAEAEAASAAIAEAVLEADTGDLAEVVSEGLDRALPAEVEGEAPFVAVRSSCVGEDSAAASFAGQMDTFLFVRGAEAVADAVRRCWASAFGARALAYRRQAGLDPADVSTGVVVQQMVPGEVSGVLFTACPTTGRRDAAVVSATHGLGEGLVSGELAADTFTVVQDGGAVDASDVQAKERRVVFDRDRGGGTRFEDVPAAEREQPCLSPEALAELADLGRRIEGHYGVPQDVEWTRHGGATYVLQARPITSLPPPPPEGAARLWDNSNIIESYSGVTSPLTYSFIRWAYSIAYRQSCEIGGIPHEVLKANEHITRRLLGLLRGNVYYDLESWSRLLALFPGDAEKQQARMEQMMGVRDSAKPIMDRVLEGRPRYTLRQKLRVVWRMIVNFLTLPRLVRRFEEHFRAGYERYGSIDWDELSIDELYRAFHGMVQHFLWNWQAPLVTDFAAMHFSGKLRELTIAYGLDPEGNFQNDLLCGEGGIESTEPTRHLMILAREAQGRPELREALEATPDGECLAMLEGREAFADYLQQVREYLERYGFRCMNELKLEEPSLREEPAFVFTVIKNYLKLPPDELQAEVEQRREREKRAAAEGVVRRSLGPLRRARFNYVLRQTRQHVKNRENMRFARTRVYGLLRELLNAMGRKLEARGELDHWHDVFYLQLDEVLGYADGTTACRDLRGLAAVRKAEFDGFRAGEEPDDRVVTLGAVHAGNAFRKPPDPDAMGDGQLLGTSVCPGRMRGKVRVIRSPSDDLSLNGEILVAARTDPGWVPLYPSVSALLIERGSPLSHSAIVARERGLPAIVNIPFLTDRVQDGMTVEMDAAQGTVRILDEAG